MKGSVQGVALVWFGLVSMTLGSVVSAEEICSGACGKQTGSGSVNSRYETHCIYTPPMSGGQEMDVDPGNCRAGAGPEYQIYSGCDAAMHLARVNAGGCSGECTDPSKSCESDGYTDVGPTQDPSGKCTYTTTHNCSCKIMR